MPGNNLDFEPTLSGEKKPILFLSSCGPWAGCLEHGGIDTAL